MILYLTVDEVLEMHTYLVKRSGGSLGLRDIGALESALAQPRMAFGGKELYPTLEEKAAALAFSLIKNHAFVDGNKRIGHYALETFLMMNGYEVVAPRDEQEQIILALAAGEMLRDEFTNWVRNHVQPLQ